MVIYSQFKILGDGSIFTSIIPVSKMKMKKGTVDKPDNYLTYNHFICKPNPNENTNTSLTRGKRVATGGNNQVRNIQRHVIF